MTDDEATKDALRHPTIPAPPDMPDFHERFDAIEQLAANMAENASSLRDELVTLSKNLDSVVYYYKRVNEQMEELRQWRDKAELRIQELEKNKTRSQLPSSP